MAPSHHGGVSERLPSVRWFVPGFIESNFRTKYSFYNLPQQISTYTSGSWLWMFATSEMHTQSVYEASRRTKSKAFMNLTQKLTQQSRCALCLSTRDSAGGLAQQKNAALRLLHQSFDPLLSLREVFFEERIQPTSRDCRKRRNERNKIRS